MNYVADLLLICSHIDNPKSFVCTYLCNGRKVAGARFRFGNDDVLVRRGVKERDASGIGASFAGLLLANGVVASCAEREMALRYDQTQHRTSRIRPVPAKVWSPPGDLRFSFPQSKQRAARKLRRQGSGCSASASQSAKSPSGLCEI